MTSTERHPLDFDTLARGQAIPAEQVERAVSLRRTDPHFRFRQLALKCEIERHFQDARGELVTVVCEGDALQILTEIEQLPYEQNTTRRSIRRAARGVARVQAIDPAKLLNDEQRASRERWLRVNSWRLQQLRKRPPPELTG